MRPTLDQYLMGLAEHAATRTTCIRCGVGCVLANERGHVLAIGYNGVAAGLPHCSLKRTGVSVGSTPIAPKPITKSHEASTYLRRIYDRCQPNFEKSFGHVAAIGLASSTVKNEIGVWVDCFPYACVGHSLPPGQDNCEAVHAEQNALLQCRDPWQIAAAYTTLSPCKACLKLLLGTSCRRIVFKEEHVDPLPKELWQRAGRVWEKA